MKEIDHQTNKTASLPILANEIFRLMDKSRKKAMVYGFTMFAGGAVVGVGAYVLGGL